MSIIESIESAAHTAVEAVEHPFHTIGARLKTAGEHLAAFFGHPYCPQPAQDALKGLHDVVSDLAQAVAELRASPSSIALDAGGGRAAQITMDGDTATATALDGAKATIRINDDGSMTHLESGLTAVTLTGAELDDFRDWKRDRAAAALKNQSGA